MARTWLADYDVDSRTGAAGAQPALVRYRSPLAQGHSPWVGGFAG